MKTQINEIFSSIQGEGTVVGYKQLFIRFCKCNLTCKYCDTEFSSGEFYTPQELYEHISANYDLQTFHSISLTGGEPLLSVEFLSEFLPLIKGKCKIYLETNATLYNEIPKIKDYIDIIATDIKLKSSTGIDTTRLHREFFKQCKGVETFAKIVFNKNITNEEITNCVEISKEYELPLILQPKTESDKLSVESDFCNEILDKFSQNLVDVRLIPQVHKFLDVR